MDEKPDQGTPRAVQACHELLAWLIPLLDQFPRSRRFTLGERLETGLLAVLEALVEAASRQARGVDPRQPPAGGRLQVKCRKASMRSCRMRTT